VVSVKCWPITETEAHPEHRRRERVPPSELPPRLRPSSRRTDRSNLEMIRKAWTGEEDEELRKALAAGVSVQRLAVRFKTRPVSVRSKAQALGLEIRPMPTLPASEMQHPAIRPRQQRDLMSHACQLH
jgi:hypothetical protein